MRRVVILGLATGFLFQVLDAQEGGSGKAVESGTRELLETVPQVPSSSSPSAPPLEKSLNIQNLFVGMDRPAPVTPPMADRLEKKLNEMEKGKVVTASVSMMRSGNTPAGPPSRNTENRSATAVRPLDPVSPNTEVDAPVVVRETSNPVAAADLTPAHPIGEKAVHASGPVSTEESHRIIIVRDPFPSEESEEFSGEIAGSQVEPEKRRIFGKGGGLRNFFSRRKSRDQVVPLK